MTRTGWFTARACHEHDTGSGHPERPERLVAIEERLESSGLAGELEHAEAQDVPVALLARVHAAAYVDRVRMEITGGARYVDSPDAPVSAASYAAALRAAGGATGAVDAVLEGRLDNAFVSVRPPGHHAEEGLAMGFCLFNNVAVAARHARDKHGLERVAVVDWDVHHGNGTQPLFERNASVFYASLHQQPH